MSPNNIEQLKNAITKVQSTIEHIRCGINSGKCNTCYICKHIGELNKDIVDLLYHAKQLFPIESDYLMAYLPGLAGVNKINPYDFGGILTIINIISSRVNQIIKLNKEIISHSEDNTPVKIFISHSSNDKPIVESFITYVLRLGCGLQPHDILCTSIESTGIKTGKDIRTYLREKLQSCDYVCFMISDDYIKSPICLNEMGGAWVLEKSIKPFLFPKSTFSDMGWLYEISKGAKLDNEEALDELRDELLGKYQLIEHPKTSDWTAQKKMFISSLFSESNDASVQHKIDRCDNSPLFS